MWFNALMEQRREKVLWVELLVVLLVCFAGPFMSSLGSFFLGSSPLRSPDSQGLRLFVMIVHELTGLALIGFILWRDQVKSVDLGLDFRAIDIPEFLGLYFITFISYQFVVASLTLARVPNWVDHASLSKHFQDLTKFPLLALAIVTINPVFEEFGVRIFAIRRLKVLGIGPWTAIILTATVQASYHLYQGIVFVLAHAVSFFILSTYYQFRSRAWPILLWHLASDSIAFAYYFVRSRS